MALYRIVIVRMRHHQPTRDYVERRIKEGKSKREIMRCLKRYVASAVDSALTAGDGIQAARTRLTSIGASTLGGGVPVRLIAEFAEHPGAEDGP